MVSWGTSAYSANQQIVPAEFSDSRTAHVIAIDANHVSTYALREDGSMAVWGSGPLPAELMDSRTAHVASFAVSWGTMLSEAQSELILGYWWQLAAVTGFMAVFVTAFALFTDALRDALDPKLRGLE